jgi:hypothetical protein
MNCVLQWEIIVIYDVRCFISWMSNKLYNALENLPPLSECYERSHYEYIRMCMCVCIQNCSSLTQSRHTKLALSDKSKQQHR